MGGCGLIVKNFPELVMGLCIRIQVGKLSPMTGAVRWLRPLDAQCSRVGIEFLE